MPKILFENTVDKLSATTTSTLAKRKEVVFSQIALSFETSFQHSKEHSSILDSANEDQYLAEQLARATAELKESVRQSSLDLQRDKNILGRTSEQMDSASSALKRESKILDQELNSLGLWAMLKRFGLIGLICILWLFTYLTMRF